jgi:glyoxylase-like metal-dependent hydrolase (beta-lactamase superfamily II)
VCDVTGDFPAPLERAFPAVAAAAWAPYRRRYPEVFSGPDRWQLRDWCFVVRTRDRVVLTHLHLDHVGWNLAWDGDRPRPRFGRARYLVQRADWELFGSRGDDNDREAFDRCVGPLQDLGVAELLDGDCVLDAELSVLHTPGHTPGSQSLLVRSGGDAALLWGDVANHPAQVDEPVWGPGSDVQPEVARRTRRRLLDRVESDRMWLAPAHFPEPFGTVTRTGDGRHWAGRA